MRSSSPSVELVAEARLEAHAGLFHPAALAPRLLALVRGEGLQVVLEARVAAVAPVELAVAPQQPAALRARRARRLVEKQRVHSREAVTHGVGFELLEQPRAGRALVEPGAQQQPRCGRGRERSCERQLRIVVTAEALVGLCPGEVEDEFAVGMGLDEGGGGRGKPMRIAQRQVARLPAAVASDAVRVLERGEELMADERVAAAVQGIPLAPIDRIDAAAELKLIARHLRLRRSCRARSHGARRASRVSR